MLAVISPAEASASMPVASALMPLPRIMHSGEPGGSIDAAFKISFPGGHATPFLQRAVQRLRVRMAAVCPVSQMRDASLGVAIRSGADPDYLSLQAREHYHLRVANAQIMLTADGPAGVLHGLMTLVELAGRSCSLPNLEIDDAPRFPWRGLMLDSARHFIAVETLKQQLDAMELLKLNVLHWHLSDGTGFRVESLRYPRLQSIGSHGQYYTQSQVREIVAYAADRGIRVVPEFDVPGHSLSILQAYPALAAQQPVLQTDARGRVCAAQSDATGTTMRCDGHANLNNAALDPTNPKTRDFVAGLLAEMAVLFPDRYIHTGGDEVASEQWSNNPQIAGYMQARGFTGPEALQAWWTAQVSQMLQADGKIMMGWDEISSADIPKSVVVEAWRGSKWVGSATASGHPVVVSSGYYLDLLRDAATHYAVDPLDTRADGLSPEAVARMRPRMGALVDAFALDPDAAPLTPQQASLVLGGEAPLWSELVTDQTLSARVWPRMAAIAERFWSDRSVRDEGALQARLPVIEALLEREGLPAARQKSRMIDALSPRDTAPLALLLSVCVPVRNYALNHLAVHAGDEFLAGPAAIASPDAPEAARFNALAQAFVAGDAGARTALQGMLERFAANDARFAAIATTPVLRAVRPVSQRLSLFGAAGLAALSGRADPAMRAHAVKELADEEALSARTADMSGWAGKPLPPSGLMLAIAPGMRVLLGGK